MHLQRKGAIAFVSVFPFLTGLLFCLAIVPPSTADAADAAEAVAEFKTLGTQFGLAPFVRYAQEDGAQWTPDEAAARLRDAPVYGGSSDWLEFGWMHGAMWLSVTIRNLSEEDRLVLEFRNPRMNFVDFYAPKQEGGWSLQQNGVTRAFDVRTLRYPMPAFPFRLAKGETSTYLLRLDNNGDFRQRVWLWDANAFTNKAATAYLSDMGTIGVLLVLAIYQFLIFLSLRERSYLYLCLFVLSWLLFLMAGNGLGKMMLWQDVPWFTRRCNSLFLIFMAAFFVLFTMSYLDSRKLTPRLYRLGQAFVALCQVQLCFTLLTDSLLRLYLNRYLIVVMCVVLVLLITQSWRKGSASARFFLVSWACLIGGGMLLLIMTWFSVPSRWLLGSPLISVLFTLSIMVWSLELIGRVRVRAQEQQRLLEAQVKERTQELEQALSEVKTLSGLLPICSSCKKIRDDGGYWNSVEQYISHHTDAGFTHGICPECFDTLYPDMVAWRNRRDSGQQAEGSA